MNKNKTTNLLLLGFIFLLGMIFVPRAESLPRSPDRDDEAILVGRISHVEGEVFRYVPEEDDWVAIVKDAPFGLDDTLYAEKGRAELIMPNNTWIRIDRETQIQLLELSQDLTEINVAQGVARFQNLGSYAVIRAETPFGYVTAPENTSFEVFVTDEAADIIPVEGTVEFVHRYSGTRYEVKAGSSSLLVDNLRVIAGEGHADADWNAWNRQRDILWANRMERNGQSEEYLPAGLYDHAYVLEDYGSWERVYYDGGYYPFWRPTYVGVGWSPFTVGRWTYWYGHHTWMPYEPFGYVTHHYGNWIFTNGDWYWAPPAPWGSVYVGSPFLSLDFAWYPGRVAWMHHGYNVGWIPLAPYEPYYCDRHWGNRSVVVRNVGVTNVYVNINKYENHGRAVIVHEKDLYRVNNYGDVRVRGVSAAMVKNQYRTTPEVSTRVATHQSKGEGKYNFTNIKASTRPQATARAKSGQNRLVIDQHRTAPAKTAVKEKISARRNPAGTKFERLSTTAKTDSPSLNRSSGPAATLKTRGQRLETKTAITEKDRGLTGNSMRLQEKGEVAKPLKSPFASGGGWQRQSLTSPQPKNISRSLQVQRNQAKEPARVSNEVQKKAAGTFFSSARKDPAVPPPREYRNQSGVPRAAVKPGPSLQQRQTRTEERTSAGVIAKSGQSFPAPAPKISPSESRTPNRTGGPSPKSYLRK